MSRKAKIASAIISSIRVKPRTRSIMSWRSDAVTALANRPAGGIARPGRRKRAGLRTRLVDLVRESRHRSRTVCDQRVLGRRLLGAVDLEVLDLRVHNRLV